MIVLRPITTAQSFPLTFKGTDADTIVLRKEGTNEQATFDVDSIVFAPNNQVITATFTGLQEGDFYQVTILTSNGVVCRERAFVTAQTPDQYSPNTNEYIIYG